jgi:hypothetical protein
MSKYVIRDENGVAIAMITDYQYKQIFDEGDIEFGVITLKKDGSFEITTLNHEFTVRHDFYDIYLTSILESNYTKFNITFIQNLFILIVSDHSNGNTIFIANNIFTHLVFLCVFAYAESAWFRLVQPWSKESYSC